ncbi:hypothetical protein ACA910_017079 [Epithemia clementina (nom. ined.)]
MKAQLAALFAQVSVVDAAMQEGSSECAKAPLSLPPQLSLTQPPKQPSVRPAQQQQQSPAKLVQELFPEELFHCRRKQSNESENNVGQRNYDDYDCAVTKAIRNKDVKTLRSMLKRGQAFNVCNRNGEYLIHLACRRADLATVKFLLTKARVDPDVRDNQGRTILHDACWRPTGDPELVSYLLEWINPKYLVAKDDRGFTPFDYVRRDDWRLWKIFCHVKLGQILQRLESQ